MGLLQKRFLKFSSSFSEKRKFAREIKYCENRAVNNNQNMIVYKLISFIEYNII